MALPLNPGSMINSVKNKLQDLGTDATQNTNSPSSTNNWWITPPGMYDPKQKSVSYNREFYQQTRDAISKLGDKSTEFFKYGIQEHRHSLDEDPTYLGFDIRINFFDSPLFNNGQINGIDSVDDAGNTISLGNGPIDSFFRWGSQKKIEDITSRKQIYLDFVNQFRLFFNGITRWDDTIGFKGFKSHYIKKVSGLENLVEKIGSDSQKQFVDFGKDLITFSMYEDISLNSGWMAMLYKTLSWSRLNGRCVLPDNLLRFDMDIVISEIRNFNKVVKAVNSNNYDVVKDNVSRYVYSLYECQLIFDNLSHQSNLDVGSSPTLNDSFDFAVKYKFATSKMEKFSIDFTKTTVGTLNVEKRYDFINNKVDSYKNKGFDGPESNVGDLPTGKIQYQPYYRVNTNQTENDGSDISKLKNSPIPQLKEKGFFEKKGEELVKLAKRSAIFAANNVIIRRARLLTDAIDKIRNSAGFGRLAPPTNVYENNALGNPLSPGAPGQFFKDQLRGFVGQTLDDFLSAGNKGVGGLLGGNKRI